MIARALSLVAAIALFVLGAYAAWQQPANVYPTLEVHTPGDVRLAFVFSPRLGVNSCETLLGNVSRATLGKCPGCRILQLNCAEDLNDEQQKLASAAPFDAPAARVTNGVIGFHATAPEIALQACIQSERQGWNQSAVCFPPGVPRTALGASRELPGAGWFAWMALTIGSVLAAAVFAYFGGVGRWPPGPREALFRVLNILGAWPRRMKQAVILIVDIVGITVALWLAFTLRYEYLYVPDQNSILLFLGAPVLAIPVFARFGLYRAIVRYMGRDTIWAIAKAIGIYTMLFGALIFFTGLEGIPRSIIPIHGFLALVMIGLPRLIARDWFNGLQLHSQFRSDQRRKPVLIYGAGSAGIQLTSALGHSQEMRPIALVDDDTRLHRQQIAGLMVHAPDDIANLVRRHGITDILLAIPSCSRQRRNQIIELLEPLPVRVQTLPGLSDLAQGKVSIADLREIEIEDLLARDPVAPDQHLLTANIRGKVVMITGAGGSIGSELCRQIARLGAQSLVLFENGEFALYAIEQELARRGSPANYPVLGSVVDQARMETALKAFKVDTVFHAAAYKHVPMVEKNPTMGIINNAFGTWHAANAAINCGVATFVLISTDKAVRPTNTMGATKRIAEMILQTLQRRHPGRTRFTMVRFGNVLGSSGSVVPLFRRQIRDGGPITVTDPRIVRYFMTIPEAAQLVIQAGAMGQGGDVFVLDMGEPVKILDLARRMIQLSGLTLKDTDHPNGDIEIVFSGLRPGEKLYEELLIGDNVADTEHPRIRRTNESMPSWEALQSLLESMKTACEQNDSESLRALLQQGVNEFNPQCGNKDLLATANQDSPAAGCNPHSMANITDVIV